MSDNPVLWRELRRPLLPRRWMRVTATAATLGLLVLSYICFSIDRYYLTRAEAQLGYAFAMHTLLLLMGVVLGATAIATEKESDTWTLLIVAPVTGQAVMWGKFAGVLRRLFWPWMVVLLHFAIFTLLGVLSVWTFLVVIVSSVAFNLVWVATGIYLSLRVNRVTTAVVLNLLLPLACYALAPLALAAIQYAGPTFRDVDLSELVLYYLPYYYEGVGIGELSRNTYYDYSSGVAFRSPLDNDVWMPFSHDQYPAILWFWMAMLVSAAHVALACLIVWWAGFRFDALVKRAQDPIR